MEIVHVRHGVLTYEWLGASGRTLLGADDGFDDEAVEVGEAAGRRVI